MGTIWTVGHSNREIGAFLGLIGGHGVEVVADVRRFPGSRRQPWFGGEALAGSLAGAGIGYRHFAGLGGRRGKAASGSPNVGWRVAAFNAYADYMGSEAFRADLGALEGLAGERRVAVMCSEVLPWRCHRRLIADALVVGGWEVLDLIGPGAPKAHALTPFARVEGGQLVYRAQEADATDDPA